MKQQKEIIELLERNVGSIKGKDRNQFYDSTTALLSICQRFYDKESAFQKDIEYVRGQLSYMRLVQSDKGEFGMDLDSLKEFFLGLLNTMIDEVKSLGLPSVQDLKIDKSVNVNVHQNQHQVQNFEFSFLIESIKDELTGKQLKELKEIFNDENKPDKAKEKLENKFKEFGVTVTSGILSSIISNPTIWAML